MKKRTGIVAGGLIVIGLGLGMLLNIFRGPGYGPGAGPGAGPGEGGDSALVQAPGGDHVPAENSSLETDVDDGPVTEKTVNEAGSVPGVKVLEIVVDEREYMLQTSTNDGTPSLCPVTLEELVQLAKLAEGNEDGVRVRIARRASSRAAAEELLQQSLLKAGVAEDAIIWTGQAAP